MKYLSTYRVIKWGEWRVLYPTVLFSFALVAGGIVSLIANLNIVAVILLFFSLLSPVFIFQHLQLSWLIWAADKVDNIPQFLKAGESHHLLRHDRFPAVRTILPYKEKKKKLEEIVLKRVNENELVVNNNVPLLAEANFYNSFIYWGLLLLFGLFVCSVPFVFSKEGNIDFWSIVVVSGIGCLIVILSLPKLLNREPILSVSKEGIMVEKLFLKWSEISNIDFVREQTQNNVTKYMKITYTDKNGILKSKRINISTLNTTVEKLDIVIKSYKK
jgi:hypothetical protein